MTLITLLLTAILVALVVQIADARRRERYARQFEENQREEQGRREQEEDTKPRRRVAVQVLVMGDELRALDAEGRQWTWSDRNSRWLALNHLMLPQVEDDKAWNLFALEHDDKLRDFLPKTKARYDAASFPWHINRASDEVNDAIREFVASLNEPEELREALEREVKREFYLYLKREEKEGRS